MQILAPSTESALPKPSLLARKDIRDAFESALPELTQTINEYLKESAYKVEVNFPQIYAHSRENSIGSSARSYLDGFVSQLKQYTEEGTFDAAIQTFNSLVSERKIAIAADDKITYEGCSIKQGVFEINYNPKNYGTNSTYACAYMAQEIDKALFAKSPYTLPLTATKSIRDEWNARKEAVLNGIKDELLGNDIKLVVDCDAVWRVIVDAKLGKEDIDIPSLGPSFGGYIHNYFDGFRFQIEYQFKRDDLMVEGFLEAVPTREVLLEVVPKKRLPSGYNECKVESGRVVLRTTPVYWGTNASYVAEGLSKLL